MSIAVIAATNSTQWKKGMRIAVEVNDDIFLAIITRVGKEKLFLEFDDGDTGKVSIGSKRILGIVGNTKRKTPVPKSKLNSYIKEKIDKPKNALVRPRQATTSPPQSTLTEEQLKYAKQYGWDVLSLAEFVKLPKQRDLLAFHVSSLERNYDNLQDLKQSMLDECKNPDNKQDISKLTPAQLKKLLQGFIKLGIIAIEKSGSANGFRIKVTPKGRGRLVGLSWAKLYQYKEISDALEREMRDYYNRSGIGRTGD